MLPEVGKVGLFTLFLDNVEVNEIELLVGLVFSKIGTRNELVVKQAISSNIDRIHQ